MPRKTITTTPYRRRTVTLRDGRQVTLRAIQPGDAGEIAQAFERLSSESRYLRFMVHKKALDPKAIARGVNPIDGREAALVATVPAADGIDIVGAARYVAADRRQTCEFSLTVAEDWRGSGLAARLMRGLMGRAGRDGYRAIEGFVMAGNAPMLALARRLGFTTRSHAEDATVCTVRRKLPAK